ncbi:MAG: hypothetical protein FJ267_05420 [Planctomycetes bacterium]|nr:hypothetical protein [Planctomycetota bacterium]
MASAAVRKKGRIVLVGVVGLELDRRPFYFKEAEFVVSCSYGPGRYDPQYEDMGHDYPAPYVRWTQQRNIQSVLDLMSRGQLNVGPLISHRYTIENAANAYEMISSNSEPYLGVVIEYPVVTNIENDPPKLASQVRLRSSSRNSSSIRCGVLGAGNFARMVMLPAIQKCSQFEPKSICSAKGLTAVHAGTSAGFETAATDENTIFDDESIGCVFSLTRHDLHAAHVLRSIEKRKHIFVEKPLCLTLDELASIEAALGGAGDHAPLIMVGFNRRFSPAAQRIRDFFSTVSSPRSIMIRFNAGDIPADHWTQSDLVGGGRLIGEACHAIDLATFLAGAPPCRVSAESVVQEGPGTISDDQCFITLRHTNGSISSIGYLASGDKSFAKERIEVFGGGRIGVIDDFRSVTTSVNGKQHTEKMTQDKGHQREIQEWAKGISSSQSPISWNDIRAVTVASCLAVQSLREGVAIAF